LENWKGKDNLEDEGIDGDNFKTGFTKLGCENVCWIHVSQDIIQWQALVNMVTNSWVP
jgi:hypothetical protein